MPTRIPTAPTGAQRAHANWRRSAVLRAVATLALLAGAWGSASAVPCGTVAAPGSCSITRGGTNVYTFSNFALSASVGTNGGSEYTESDIEIEVLSLNGLSVGIRFSKNPGGSNPGTVFGVNGNDQVNFSINYTVTLSAAAPGVVDWVDPMGLSMAATSFQGGYTSVQSLMDDAPTDCALSGATSSTSCSMAADPALSFAVASNVALFGNGGNASLVHFTNTFSSSFEPGVNAVPEPAGMALLGLAMLGLLRARQKRDAG